MFFRDFFTHYPSRLLWVGSGFLGTMICFSAILLFPIADQPPFPAPPRQSAKKVLSEPLARVHLSNSGDQASWVNLSAVKDQVSISLSPPRPGSSNDQMSACVKIKGSQWTRRISLPGRIDLVFHENGTLGFSEKKESPFWMDLSLDSEGRVAGTLTAIVFGEKQQASFYRVPDSPPWQKGEEFPPLSALSMLGEAKWLGADLVCQLEFSEQKQRLEIGSNSMDIGASDWLYWQDGRWSKIKDISSLGEAPIARIRSVSSQTLEWDAWEGLSHYRLSLPSPSNSSRVLPKVEEWFGSLRIRSDKQISCMIEKQCFVLRIGDWILKENGKWRILRKKEEREQLVSGTKSGELFVLDKIDRTQKSIKGRLFLAHRTQSLPVELSAANKSTAKRTSAMQKPGRLGSLERAG